MNENSHMDSKLYGTINGEDIISGNSPRSQLNTWLKQRQVTQTEFAKRTGLNEDTVRNFIKEKSMRPETIETIYKGIRAYESGQASNQEETYKTEEVKIESKTSSIEFEFRKIHDVLNKAVNYMVDGMGAEEAARILAQKYQPKLEDRINTINLALTIIADELNYFRLAPGEELKSLAKKFDVPMFGYVVNMLGGVHKEEGSETILRLYPPPERKRLMRRGEKSE